MGHQTKPERSISALAVAIAVLACSATRAADLDDPAAELASFKVADGFEVNLFASEPEGVANPIQMRFDAEGRLYVACSWVYPQLEPGQKADDKIFVLEDTDGDGRADKTSVFADGLFLPTGIELGDRGLYVGNGTELLHLADSDGDGRADRRRVVLHGFGTGDSHQNINSFCWGPGGELMFSQGLHAFSRVETPWGIERLDEAGVWRLRPRRLRLDGFFGHGLPPHNPWGFVFDDWGQLFVVAGNGHGMFHPLPVMIRGHRPVPLDQIWENFRGRKLCGVDIVGTRHLPDALQGAMIAGGFMNNAVYCFRISEEGSGFRVVDLPPLILSTHTSFRPVDVKVGPDGAIYVADWYNPIIGHYQASFRHPDRDKTHGRIWRITAKGRPLVPKPSLANAPLPQLLDSLKSPERWVRYQAKRVLAESDTGQMTNALVQWIAGLAPQDPLFEHHLLEALGVHETHEVVEPALLQRLLRAKDYRARAYATGVIGHWQDRLEDPLALLSRQVSDEHPRVRLAAVVAATYVPSAQSLAVAATAADKPMDKSIEYALAQAVFVLKPHWLPEFTAGRLTFDGRPKRLEFVLKADGSRDTFRSLLRLLENKRLAAETREAFLRIVANVGAPADLAPLLTTNACVTANGYSAAMHARVLTELVVAAKVRQVRPAGDVAAALKGLLASAPEEVRAETLRLAGLWKVEALEPELTRHALSERASAPVRRAAIEALALAGKAEGRAALSQLLNASQPAAVRAKAIAALAAFSPQAAGDAAAALLAATLDDALVTELFAAFLQRDKGADALAASLAAKPAAADAAKLGLRLMASVGRQDSSLLAVLSRAAGLGGEAVQMTDQEAVAFGAEARDHGDPKRGEGILRRPELGCVACHTVNGEGGTTGPDLSAIGSGQPVDFIIGAILTPNREVKEGYHAVEVVTKDGETYQGYKVRADKQELLLRDVLLKREVRIRADNIQEQIDRGSLMPSGLVDQLTRAEFRDLVRYLSGLGKAGGP